MPIFDTSVEFEILFDSTIPRRKPCFTRTIIPLDHTLQRIGGVQALNKNAPVGFTEWHVFHDGWSIWPVFTESIVIVAIGRNGLRRRPTGDGANKCCNDQY
ncbi:hypothetical protein [uncultured Tateyamaria sp.]|uniref:hypothetical protein n=1 Tax=uncultured Tateyamaria sp. TaxID=455651 RepID=UPI00261F3297|nr:hypothetical protein [uncultured Tateyamaria sp.]